MTIAQILSISVAIGIILFILTAFGLTWKVLGIGIVISTVCSIIYYKLLKKIGLGD